MDCVASIESVHVACIPRLCVWVCGGVVRRGWGAGRGAAQVCVCAHIHQSYQRSDCQSFTWGSKKSMNLWVCVLPQMQHWAQMYCQQCMKATISVYMARPGQAKPTPYMGSQVLCCVCVLVMCVCVCVCVCVCTHCLLWVNTDVTYYHSTVWCVILRITHKSKSRVPDQSISTIYDTWDTPDPWNLAILATVWLTLVNIFTVSCYMCVCVWREMSWVCVWV